MYQGTPVPSHPVPRGNATDRVVAALQRILRVAPNVERHLRQVETLVIGQRKAVHLIECKGEFFLVTEGLSAPAALIRRSEGEL